MEKGLKLLKIDLAELEKEKKWILEERVRCKEMCAEWLKKTPNKVWSKQQVKYLDK